MLSCTYLAVRDGVEEFIDLIRIIDSLDDGVGFIDTVS